jgi:hypothetical protein
MNNFGSIFQDFLRCKYKGSEYVCGETYESLIWMEKNVLPKPSLEECISGIAEYQSKKSLYDYAVLRAYEYPTIVQQLEMLWDSMDSGEIPKSKDFYDTIKSVKDKFPKP